MSSFNNEQRIFKKGSSRSLENMRHKMRESALLQQKMARANLTAQRRELVKQAVAPSITGIGGKGKKKRHETAKHRKTRLYWSKQLMYPQWMVDVPLDLAYNWLLIPRPEGTRCLVVVSNGLTISRRRNGGNILHRFSSALPNGNPFTAQGDLNTILDCIFHSPTQTYWILDVMSWKNYDLYECTAEFRLFWLQSKLAELGEGLRVKSDVNEFPFCALPVAPCSVENLRMCYASAMDTQLTQKLPFQQDGMLFVHKESHYVMESNPLLLLWKDNVCARYVIDTSDGKTIKPAQECVLRVEEPDQAEGKGMMDAEDAEQMFGLQTLEGLTVGHVSRATLDQLKIDVTSLKNTVLIRFTLQDIDLSSGKPVLSGLSVAGPGPVMRVLPDGWTKIVFQNQLRHHTQIVIDTIASCIKNAMRLPKPK